MFHRSLLRSLVSTVLNEGTMADILASGHSRVPVFAGERRNVLGLLLVKRLMPVSPSDGRRVGEFVFRSPTVLHPETSLLDALNAFQKARTHMALVSPQVAQLKTALASRLNSHKMCSTMSRPNINHSKDSAFLYDCDPSGSIPASVDLQGLLTVEDVMEKLIGEDIHDETDRSAALNSALSAEQQRPSPRILRLRDLARQAQLLTAATNRMRSHSSTLGRVHSRNNSASASSLGGLGLTSGNGATSNNTQALHAPVGNASVSGAITGGGVGVDGGGRMPNAAETAGENAPLLTSPTTEGNPGVSTPHARVAHEQMLKLGIQ